MPGFQLLVGSRAQVWHGTARQTAYGKKGLRKGDLKKNKQGKIVSRRASKKAKKKGTLKKWMKDNDLEVKKGSFGLQKKSSKKKSSKKGKGTRKRRRTRRKHKKGHRCRHARGSLKGKFRKCRGYNH